MKKNVKSNESLIPSAEDFTRALRGSDEPKEPRLPRCAICGEAVQLKGKDIGKALEDGNVVCRDCYESSPMIVTCDECGKEMLATDGTKDDGTLYCPDCFRQTVLDSDFIGVSFEDWAEDLEEGQTASLDEWAKYMREYVETARKESMDVDYYVSRKWMKVALEETEKRIEAARA
jgi:DNA-directed RNA polymerase subunit RPC12/RpoP